VNAQTLGNRTVLRCAIADRRLSRFADALAKGGAAVGVLNDSRILAERIIKHLFACRLNPPRNGRDGTSPFLAKDP
jgi:hypothetical protein